MSIVWLFHLINWSISEAIENFVKIYINLNKLLRIYLVRKTNNAL